MINVKPYAGVAGGSTTRVQRTREGERLNIVSFSRRRLKISGIGQPGLCRPRATGAHTTHSNVNGGPCDE